MTFKGLRNIIFKNKQQRNSQEYDPYAEERAKLIEFDKQLTEAFSRSYKKRKNNWFTRHPEAKCFEPSLEETYQDTEPAEWHWYFWQYLKQTPEQRYQERKKDPLSHDSSWYIRNLPRDDGNGCGSGSLKGNHYIPTCRFYSEEGRIESIEVLHYYEKYRGFEEALNSWNSEEAQ
jgi:hypothetical protein